MPTVYHASRFNSTYFTTCCHVAIQGDADLCPKCRADIEPKGERARWEKAYGPQRAIDRRATIEVTP